MCEGRISVYKWVCTQHTVIKHTATEAPTCKAFCYYYYLIIHIWWPDESCQLGFFLRAGVGLAVSEAVVAALHEVEKKIN